MICPDFATAQALEKVLSETRAASVARRLDRFVPDIELSRILRAHAPQVVFVSIDSVELCVATAAQVEQVMPGAQVIAVGRSSDTETLMTVMRAGIREYLAAPFERSCVVDAITRAQENLRKRPLALQSSDLLFSFLPSKPGTGTTTIAVNAAMAAADTDTALLMDFDLNCGMVRFLLKLESTRSVVEAAEHACNMDEQLWGQLVTRRGSLDVLHAGSLNPDIRLEAMQVQHLLDFARRNYKVVCADLSGNLEKYSLEIMHESKQVFLVCTPEVSSLHLAREKMIYLQRMDLGDRVAILVNRHGKRGDFAPSDVESLVGAPVLMSFPNDYRSVALAISEGKPVPSTSEFGRQCGALARHLLQRNEKAPEQKRRFVEYFALSPAKFSFETRR
jgi:pilus assembly protein CpaE